MAFFARSAHLLAQALVGLMEQLLQQRPSIFQQRLAQTQFHRLQIADTLTERKGKGKVIRKKGKERKGKGSVNGIVIFCSTFAVLN